MVKGKQGVDSPIPRDLRVSPRQARARETVGRILDTAAVLLDEVGFRTVYRYFPNKSAVILALAERVVSEWDAWALDELAKLDEGGDWRTAVERATRGLLQRVRELPGHAAIRRAMRAVPELYSLDQRDNVRLAEAYARALQRVAPELELARARRIARCLIESTAAIMDVALEQSPASARGLIDELVRMQLAYLEAILA
jgi:AcrR family transcriptional regulator